jgi:hypothetical protein
MKIIQTAVVILFSIASVSCQINKDTPPINPELSKEEIVGMKFMLEEEKVAYDVYSLLDKKWGLRVFSNIKQSEESHINAIKNLLERKGISYQLKEEAGKFYNEELQKMYDDLVAKGTKSKKDALEVGVMVEEKDITDLKEAIKLTKDEHTKNVYQNLLEASYRHLSAFNKNLSRY